jgi:hypothetical protein
VAEAVKSVFIKSRSLPHTFPHAIDVSRLCPNQPLRSAHRAGGYYCMDLAVAATGGDPGHAPARRSYEKAGYTALPLVRFYRAVGDS